MCNSTNCSHDHLDDDLSDLLGDGPARVVPAVAPAQPFALKGDSLLDAPIRAKHETAAAAAGHRYEERCGDCRGTGSFYSYTGRYVGPCFKCKGKGVLVFKTSPEAREAARNAAKRLRQQKAETLRANAQAWLEANPAEGEWLRQPITGSFTFHADMLSALFQYGSFTEKQEASVRKATASAAVRRAQWAAEKAAREEGAATLTLDKIRAGFDSASKHLKRPKLRIADIEFSLAPASGRNAGCIYVKRADDTYLGKITPEDKFITSRDCTATDSATVARVAADPAAAATAHGHEYGQCSCCGRELTNPESVARGIGPICAERWGW